MELAGGDDDLDALLALADDGGADAEAAGGGNAGEVDRGADMVELAGGDDDLDALLALAGDDDAEDDDAEDGDTVPNTPPRRTAVSSSRPSSAPAPGAPASLCQDGRGRAHVQRAGDRRSSGRHSCTLSIIFQRARSCAAIVTAAAVLRSLCSGGCHSAASRRRSDRAVQRQGKGGPERAGQGTLQRVPGAPPRPLSPRVCGP